MKKISINKNIFILIYKLLHDGLFLTLLTFAAMLIAEGLLPGLITSKVSYNKIIILLLAIIGLIIYLGKHLGIAHANQKLNKIKVLPALIFFAFFLIGNSMLLFTFWENVLITIITLFAFFLFYRLIFEQIESK